MSCYWRGSDQARAITGRHLDDCDDETCRGCQPCPRPHCRVCAKEHADQTCPGCLNDTRETLAEIRRLCASLPAEVIHRGVNSEAMNLLGPVADPEQTGHVSASIAVGRLPGDWLETADNEHHPLLVLGTWMEAYVEAFDHDEPERITVAGSASYLDRNLSYAATEPDIPFEDFARDLRVCQAHIERVLHDGPQIEQGAPCLSCEDVRLELVRSSGEDCWRCPRCHQSSNDAQYRFAVRAAFIAKSPELNVDDMAIRTGIGTSTIRRWTHVKRDQKDGEDVIELPAIIKSVGRVNDRKVYLVADVEFVAKNGAERLRGTWLAPSSLPTPRGGTVSTSEAPVCPDREAAESSVRRLDAVRAG